MLPDHQNQFEREAFPQGDAEAINIADALRLLGGESRCVQFPWDEKGLPGPSRILSHFTGGVRLSEEELRAVENDPLSKSFARRIQLQSHSPTDAFTSKPASEDVEQRSTTTPQPQAARRRLGGFKFVVASLCFVFIAAVLMLGKTIQAQHHELTALRFQNERIRKELDSTEAILGRALFGGEPIAPQDLEDRYRRIVEHEEKSADELKIATARFNLAAALVHNVAQLTPEKINEARTLLNNVIVTREKRLGSNDRSVGIALAALAAIEIAETGDSTLAKTVAFLHLKRAIDILESNAETDGEVSFYVTYLHAHFAWSNGRKSDAEALYAQAVLKCRTILGEDHPFHILVLGAYAGSLRDNQKMPQAEAVIRQALFLSRRGPMRLHFAFAKAAIELGKVCEKRNDDIEAKTLFLEALDTAKKIRRDDIARQANDGLDELRGKSKQDVNSLR